MWTQIFCTFGFPQKKTKMFWQIDKIFLKLDKQLLILISSIIVISSTYAHGFSAVHNIFRVAMLVPEINIIVLKMLLTAELTASCHSSLINFYLLIFQAGVLNVHIVEAKGLVNKDSAVFGQGKSDPYATLEVRADGETQNFKTEVWTYNF